MLLFPACQEGQFGRNCQETCQRAQGCRGLSFCLPDPYGCSCASGWSGSRCDQGTGCPSAFPLSLASSRAWLLSSSISKQTSLHLRVGTG